MVQNPAMERWLGLCGRLGIERWHAQEHYRWLDHNYSDPLRALHVWSHIDDLLGFIDARRDRLSNFDMVEFAVWNHDAILTLRRKPRGFPADETLSAWAADELLAKAGKPIDTRAMSFSLICVTDHKEDKARTTDEMILADGDWSGLAAPWDVYIANREKVRREHSYLTDAEFNNARLAWVLKACRRKSHFYLPEFKTKFDTATQENLTRELKEFRFV